MSTAKNHSKRSHRSNFSARAFNGARRNVITPTIRKDDYFSFIRMLRQAMGRNRETRRADMQRAAEA